jgi:phage gpG-like protein
MQIEAVPGLISAFKVRASDAAPPVVMAIASAYRRQVERELRLRAHPPGTWTNSPRGQPPALMTGRLVGSLTESPGASTGTLATATVAPHTVYASVQEYGREIYARRHKYMKWRNDHGVWYKKRVFVPPRPYMRPALTQSIEDGSLTRAAVDAFQAAMGGLAG